MTPLRKIIKTNTAKEYVTKQIGDQLEYMTGQRHVAKGSKADAYIQSRIAEMVHIINRNSLPSAIPMSIKSDQVLDGIQADAYEAAYHVANVLL